MLGKPSVDRPGGPTPLSPDECSAVADFLQGFANPVRIRILCCLHEGPKNVSQVSVATGEKVSNVSQQLKILLQKGYVTRQKRERQVFYEIRNPAICELMELVRDIVFGGSVRAVKSDACSHG
ncbi:MAG: metalloregulator ArsR/SmtB family transcription factor [Firmicutes bacterium]|nr:metalloregulator ArsR/SmtB family transcription factor [Bacillota bacterium]